MTSGNSQMHFVDEQFVKNIIKMISPQNPYSKDFLYFLLPKTLFNKQVSFCFDIKSHKDVTQIIKFHNENSDYHLQKNFFSAFDIKFEDNLKFNDLLQKRC